MFKAGNGEFAQLQINWVSGICIDLASACLDWFIRGRWHWFDTLIYLAFDKLEINVEQADVKLFWCAKSLKRDEMW
ncbi:hypothetical protein CTI12_AA541750 [Artemisia annua]|uniref:Uncharacterized protein n=1 Tax=Artemisia annua TaxID=35608 RepID=A0A2U1L0M8_ARTAN|nr:hypothetical protein CTI12_AA541750 [Artemisia annua]